MPLSQGYYMKPSVATKRALKALRKESQQLQSQSQSQHTQLLHPGSATSSTHTHTLQALLQSNHNNNNSNNNNKSSQHLSYLLGESFARSGSLPQAFDVYELIASRQLDGLVPLDKLAALASALTARVRQLTGSSSSNNNNVADTMLRTLELDKSPDVAKNRVASPATLNDDLDPLLCPLCRDLLRAPVTTNCGHTFCGQCCETITQCNICLIKFPRVPQAVGAITSTTSSSSNNNSGNISHSNINSVAISSASLSFLTGGVRLTVPAPTTVTTTTVASTTATATTTMASSSSASATASASSGMGGYALGVSTAMKFMPDVLVRRLVEKWWGAELLANKIVERANSCMHANRLDDALKFCNASLEKVCIYHRPLDVDTDVEAEQKNK
ncbi:hypothetical protein ACLKA7_017596 [Drosophila subpalustris]